MHSEKIIKLKKKQTWYYRMTQSIYNQKVEYWVDFYDVFKLPVGDKVNNYHKMLQYMY